MFAGFLLALVTLAFGSVIQTPTQIAIANANQQNVPIKRTIDSIFLKFPSETDLENIIFSADALALAKLIQTIEIKGE